MAEATNKEEKKTKFTPETVDDEIPHPYFELYRHTFLRGANSGSFLALILAPPILYIRGKRTPRELAYHTAKASVYGMAIGAAFSVISTWLLIRNQTEDQVFDRSYRLRYNKGQNHMDFVTYGTVGTGALAGALTAPALRSIGALYGASVGFGLSVPIHMMTKRKD